MYELSSVGRKKLKAAGLTFMLKALTERFAMGNVTANIKLGKRRITLRDLTDDATAMTTFLQKSIRYANLVANEINTKSAWKRICTTAWLKLLLAIKLYIQQSDTFRSFLTSMARVSTQRVLLTSAAKQHAQEHR
ncbi:hypothetical protein Micbo1qcDRAFT_210409 [Microdochium bolleyi]|uniref:Uncharacterized protein n=1 Tax=Microdochium bolleyi TaxID=196109 RepID=A0A136IIS1_9PEZI|nr:hypothetical protein Micbo1qcDRAFT_210409 [Microdochium bolleyi]